MRNTPAPDTNISLLAEELSDRMYKDYRRMAGWRQFHRTIAIVFNLILIITPAVMAVGLISSENLEGRICLLLITIIGAANTTFKPYLHSHRRRMDMNAIRRLRDEFRGEIAGHTINDKHLANSERLIETYQKYSNIFSNMYELRGRELIDATLSLPELREVAGQKPQDALDNSSKQPK